MLKITDLQKTFNPGTVNAKTALSGLNLTLNDGDFVTVIGGNGAGKSTLLNAISGVWKPDYGTIELDGIDVTSMPEHKRAKFLGRVFQDPMKGTAPDMEIAENLAIASKRGIKRKFVWGVKKSDRVYFKQLLSTLELGLEDRLSTKVGLLSGGQRQAVTLLMATLNRPKLLLLDEPAAGMNPHETEDLLKTIRTIRDRFDMTVLLIEHDMKFVSGLCDEVTVLNFGTVLAEGDTKTALSDPAVIKAYIGG